MKNTKPVVMRKNSLKGIISGFNFSFLSEFVRKFNPMVIFNHRDFVKKAHKVSKQGQTIRSAEVPELIIGKIKSNYKTKFVIVNGASLMYSAAFSGISNVKGNELSMRVIDFTSMRKAMQYREEHVRGRNLTDKRFEAFAHQQVFSKRTTEGNHLELAAQQCAKTRVWTNRFKWALIFRLIASIDGEVCHKKPSTIASKYKKAIALYVKSLDKKDFSMKYAAVSAAFIVMAHNSDKEMKWLVKKLIGAMHSEALKVNENSVVDDRFSSLCKLFSDSQEIQNIFKDLSVMSQNFNELTLVKKDGTFSQRQCFQTSEGFFVNYVSALSTAYSLCVDHTAEKANQILKELKAA